MCKACRRGALQQRLRHVSSWTVPLKQDIQRTDTDGYEECCTAVSCCKSLVHRLTRNLVLRVFKCQKTVPKKTLLLGSICCCTSVVLDNPVYMSFRRNMLRPSSRSKHVR
jgi:hypothetical protein